MKKCWKGSALLMLFFVLWGGLFFSCSSGGTQETASLSGVSIQAGENTIAADGETTLTAQVEPAALPGTAYRWSITKVDNVAVDSCAYATLTNTTSKIATLKATNNEAAEHTVTVELVVTYGSIEKKAEATVTIQAKSDTTVTALTGVTITGASEIAAQGETTLTASPVYTGNDFDTTRVIYAWTIIKSDETEAATSDFARLTPDTADSSKATVNGTNTTTAAHKVTVKVTATYGETTQTTTKEIIVVAKDATVTDKIESVSLASAGYVLDATGTVSVTATPHSSENPTLTYTWSIEGETDYVKLPETTTGEGLSTIELTGNNTDTASHSVTIKVVVSDGTNQVYTTASVTVKAAPVTPQPIVLTGVSISGATTIGAASQAELTASATHTGDNYDASKVTYTWAIVKSDGIDATASDYATLTPNAADTFKATVNGTNATDAAHKVTVKVTATYNGDASNAVSTEYEITISAVPVKNELTDLGLVAAKSSLKASDSVELTATASYTGSPTIAYTWEIVSGSDCASLEFTSGGRAAVQTETKKNTLTVTNKTASVKEIVVKVTANDGTNTKIADVTVSAGSAEITAVSISGETAIAKANGMTTLTATPTFGQDGTPEVEYAWEITEGSEYATIEGSGKTATVTGKNGTKDAQKVKVTVTAKNKNDSTNAKADTVEVTVAAKTLVKIEVTESPAKTTYFVGDAFSSDGLKVTATYSDDTTVVVTDKVTLSGNTTAVAAESQKVTITYADDFGSKEASYTIVVKADSVTSIGAVLADTAKKWTEDDAFASSDVTVTASWESGKTTTLAATAYTVSPATLAKDTESITVTHTATGKTTTVAIHVEEKIRKTITGVTISGSQSIAADAEVTLTATATTTGDPTLTYGWNIKENTSAASLSGSTTNTVTLKANNTSTDAVKVTIIVTATDSEDATITATSQEFEVTIAGKNVVVKDEVTSVTIQANATEIATTGTTTLTAQPVKTGSPVVTYAWEITAGGDYAELSATTGETVTLTGKNTTKSAQTVKVSVTAKYTADGTEKSVQVAAPTEITVAAKTLTNIAIASQPTKKTYYVGDTFSSDGLKVTANYSDGTTADVTDKVIFSGNTTAIAAESQKVTVTYIDDFGTKTADFAITVVADSITGINAVLVEKEWVDGLAFTASDVVVTPVYASGKTGSALASGYSVSPATLSKTTTSILVTYGEFTKSVSITVKDDYITTITAALKDGVSYTEGDTAKADDVTVTASWASGKTPTTLTTGYTVSPATELSTADNTLTVTLTADTTKTASVSVTVAQSKVYVLKGESAEISLGKTSIDANAYLTYDAAAYSTSYNIKDYDPDIYPNLSNSNREVAFTVKNVAAFTVYIKNTTPGRKFTVKTGDNAAIEATHPGSVNGSDVVPFTFNTGTSAQTTIKLAGVDGSVYAGYIVLYAAEKEIPATSVVISGKPDADLVITDYPNGTTYDALTAAVTPSWHTSGAVVWSSSNTTVATIDSASGKIQPVAAGKTTITATVGEATDSFELTVAAANVAVTGVTLDKTTLELDRGKTETLVATVAPEDATNPKVIWSSDNESVATIKDGVVKAVSAGTATITAKTEDGNKTATCAVTVKAVYVAAGKYNLSTNKVEGYTVDGSEGAWTSYSSSDASGLQTHDNIIVTSKIDSNGPNLYSDAKKGTMTFTLNKMMKVTFGGKGGSFGKVGKISTTNGKIEQFSTKEADNATVAADGLSSTIANTTSGTGNVAVLVLSEGDYTVIGNDSSAFKLQTIIFEEYSNVPDPNTGISAGTGWSSEDITVTTSGNTATVTLPAGVDATKVTYQWMLGDENADSTTNSFTLPASSTKGKRYLVTALVTIDGVVYGKSVAITYTAE